MGEDDIKLDQFERIILKAKHIYCDSVIFSYHFHNHPNYSYLTARLFELLEKKRITIVTSCLAYLEILSLKQLEKDLQQRLLIKEFFLSQPNLQMNQTDVSLIEHAAQIRRTGGLKAVDALQLATAQASVVKIFLTNDKDFRRISQKQFPIVFLDEFVS